MIIEEKFNKRSATPVPVQSPTINVGHRHSKEGMKLTFFRAHIPDVPHDGSSIAMHMTPDEALALAARLIQEAQRAMKQGVDYHGPDGAQ